MQDEAERVAAGLTKAQRETMLAFNRHGYYSSQVKHPVADELLALALIEGPGRITHPSQRGLPPEYLPTPLGLAVANIIRSQSNG